MFSSYYHLYLLLLLLLLIFLISVPYCFAIRDLMISVSPTSVPSNTISQIMVPPFGLGDGDTGNNILHTTEHFELYPGKPRWTQTTLTYALSPYNTIGYLKESDIKEVFRRAFTRWASVIPVNFTEDQEYSKADIKIGFYKGDHGDGKPFDGVLGVLGHAFYPQNGRLHLDAAETWSIDFRHEKSNVAFDLESVVTHEIGHILGLDHSKVKEAVMYPSLRPRTKRFYLSVDDVKGVQALYGSNPNFKFSNSREPRLIAAFGLLWSFFALLPLLWMMFVLYLDLLSINYPVLF